MSVTRPITSPVTSPVTSRVVGTEWRRRRGGVVVDNTLDKISAKIPICINLQRLLSAYTGPAIKVRRSSDNAEQDINFTDDGLVDTASLLTFVGAGDGLVVTWYDQTANGINLTSGGSQWPKIVSSGELVVNERGKLSLLFDGFNDSLYNTIDLSGATGATFGVAAESQDNANRIAFIYGTTALYANIKFKATSTFDLRVSADDLLFRSLLADSTSKRTMVLTGVVDTTEATNANKSFAMQNGRIVNTNLGLNVGSITSELFDERQIAIGGIPSTVTFANIKATGFAVANEALTGDELDKFNRALGVANGTYLSATANISELDYTNEATESDGVIKGSAFSGVSFDTSADLINVESFNSTWGTFSDYTRIGVYVDGAYHASANPNGVGTRNASIYLPSGSKRLTLYNGLTSKPTTTVIGTWLKSVSANATLTPVTIDSSGGIVVYGDSIAVGSDADPIQQNSWVQLVRHDAEVPLIVEGWGYRSLNEDGTSGALLDSLVTKLLLNSPTIIWLAIGTNDYGLNKWGASSFESAYDSLLQKIHAADADVTIYAQTPLVRTTETANGSGSTLGDYRTAISNAATGKAYVTVVDGTAIMTTASLADGVHPTTAGHALYSDYVKTVLGIA